MSDPFLLQHRVGHRQYNISESVSPASIRDQMIRGRLVVDRLTELGHINRIDRRLLVIGAGAAGATAAMRAAETGIHTTLVDRDQRPFMRQRGCMSRWLDPAQYDWPLEHWTARTFPWASKPMPLPWSAAHAVDVAGMWDIALTACRAAHRANLEIYPNTTCPAKPQRTGALLDVQLVTGTTQRTQSFGAVVIGHGPGSEKCTIGAYSGFRFWDTDTFEQPNLGLPSGIAPAILISGGGDGALQDFLRITTGESSAKTLYQQLRNTANDVPWTKVEAAIQCAEDQATRAYVWGANDGHDHGVLQTLQSVHEQQVRTIFSIRSQQLEYAMRGMLRQPVPSVLLVCRCTHFARAYALNRFLVLLIAEYANRADRRQFLKFGHELEGVAGVSHTCQNDPQACFGQDHEGKLIEASCFSKGVSSIAAGTHNVVVVRHGVRPPDKRLGTFKVRLPRQILPYVFP